MMEEHKITVTCSEKLDMYYRIYNPARLHTKIPLVCAHHISGNCSDYEHLAKEISDFAVITPDMVGRGKSHWLTDPTLYNHATYCSCIMQLLHHLGVKRFRFLGASMGGITGIFLAARFPEKVDLLILNDVGPYIAAKPLSTVVQFLLRYPSFKDLDAAKKRLKTCFVNFGIDQEAFWDHLVKNYVVLQDGSYSLAYDPTIGLALQQELEQSGGVMDIWETWEKITCKVLVLRGDLSNVLTTNIIERMLASKPGCVEAITYPDVGHLPALYPKHRISDVLRWLDKHGQHTST